MFVSFDVKLFANVRLVLDIYFLMGIHVLQYHSNTKMVTKINSNRES